MSSTKPFFSIVIPSLDEEKYLPHLLDDLAQQSFKDFEVIHVDGNSDDKTVAVARQFSSSLHIQSHVVTLRNVSHQRNIGAAKAKGDWIIFMDADNRIKKDFLEEVFQQLEQLPDTEAFSCFLDIRSRGLLEKRILELANTGMEICCKIKPFAGGALIGVKKEVVSQVHFNETLKMSEDHQFVNDVANAGFTFRFLPKPKFFMSMRRFEKEGSLKMVWIYARSIVVFLSGNKLVKLLPEYEMGGAHYSSKKGQTKVFFPRVQLIIKKASQKQIDQLLSLLSLRNP